MTCKRYAQTWKVDAQRECIDFVKNGYQVIFSSFSNNSWAVKFRHERTNKILFIHASAKALKITKNGNVVKTITYSPSRSFGSFRENQSVMKKLW